MAEKLKAPTGTWTKQDAPIETPILLCGDEVLCCGDEVHTCGEGLQWKRSLAPSGVWQKEDAPS